MSGSRGPAASTAPRRAGTPGAPALWFVHALGDSSLAFEALLASSLATAFDLWAPDWPGTGVARAGGVDDLDGLADWLTRSVDRHTSARPVGLVGHSLGAAVAVRAVGRLERVVGLFSIEGNLTAADAYLSGLAPAFEAPEEYRDHLLSLVRARAEDQASGRSESLWRYHASLRQAAPDALWRIGRSAKAASDLDALGGEYRDLSVPGLYYWSRESAPPETQEYIRNHALRNVVFAAGHWPMVEQPQETAEEIAAFFRPLFRAYEGRLER